MATLHQPRVEIFDIINMLYLLAPGGRVAYFGPGFGLATHLRKLGFNCPPSSNVSDFVMDVISGFIPPSWNPHASTGDIVSHICDYTYDEMHAEFEKENARVNRRTTSRSFSFGVTDMERNRSTALYTFRVCFFRQLKIYYRTVASSISPPFLVLLMGILIAQLFGSCDISANIYSQVMSSQLAFAVTIQPMALRLFLSDALIRERESGGGIRFGPLYLGKLCGNFMELIISPLAFVCGYYPFIEARAPIHMYIWLFFLLMLAVTGLTNMCAIVFESKRAGTIAGGMLIVLWAVGGITPTVSKIRDNLGVVGDIFIAVTPFRKTFEIAITMELKQYSDFFDAAVTSMYSLYSMQDDRNGLNMLYLVCHWIVTNTIALLAMIWYRDNCRYWRDFKNERLFPLLDLFLTSKFFMWCEINWDNLTNGVSAMDEKIAKALADAIQCFGFDDEDNGENGGVCSQYLQDLLMKADKTLDSPCDKCGHAVNEHRRQSKVNTNRLSWSSQAIKRLERGAKAISASTKPEPIALTSLKQIHQGDIESLRAASIPKLLRAESRTGHGSFYDMPDETDSSDEETGVSLGRTTTALSQKQFSEVEEHPAARRHVELLSF